MILHHSTTSRHSEHAGHSSLSGYGVVVLAFLIPLSAVFVMTWLGARNSAIQAQNEADKAHEIRTEIPTALVYLQLRRSLDALAEAALNNLNTIPDLPALAHAQEFGIYNTDAPPSDRLLYKAFRTALFEGRGLVVNNTTVGASIILAAADHPNNAQRIALAVISPADLLPTLSSSAFEGGAVLLDRSLNPLTETAVNFRTQHNAPVPSQDNPVIKTVRPIEDFPLNIGFFRSTPDSTALMLHHGRAVLISGAVCALLVTLFTALLIVFIRRRLLEAERKREFALQEIEHIQKLSSIGRLAAGVAHEINNPLALIAEKAGLVKDLAGAAPDMPKSQRFVALSDSVLQAVARCRAVTHRLLGFARRMEVRTLELNLNDVLREVLGFLEREALFRSITLEQDLDENLPLIESDRGQLQQIFLNLLNNAMAAVSDNGHIRIGTRPENNGVRVEVEDNGVGMSREVLSHIFEPFYSTKGEQGTGLGLSITYGIVDKLGGSIEVQSEEGKGTMFTVHLPLLPPSGGHATAHTHD